jgi:predicted secreted protein
MRALAAIIVAAASLAATATAGVGAAPPKRVSLDVGDELAIRLPGKPSTGYVWRLRFGDRRVLKPLGSKYVPAKHPPNVVGRGGIYVFRFRAVAPGRTLLRFVYARSFAPKQGPTVVEVVVVVT